MTGYWRRHDECKGEPCGINHAGSKEYRKKGFQKFAQEDGGSSPKAGIFVSVCRAGVAVIAYFANVNMIKIFGNQISRQDTAGQISD